MRYLISLITFGVLLAGPVCAEHWHDDEDHWGRHARHEGDDDRAVEHHARECYFRPADARVLAEYYAPRRHELPPGLQGKLYRTGHLPPGWQKRMRPVPVDIQQRLMPLPVGYSRGFIDGYAVVYSPRTQVVVDIVAVFGR
jgi:hypothetical protein